MDTAYIRFEDVTKSFGTVPVVSATNLSIARNSFVVFLGPSGCGKTTLMRMVGGLDSPSAGTIRLDGEIITAPDRRRGMVFQSYSSFPWLTVEGNIAFGMRYRNDLDEARRLITALAGLVTAADPDLGPHRGPMRDGLRSLQLAFREASAIPDAEGAGPGEAFTGPVR